MRAVVQRVVHAQVRVGSRMVGRIDAGLLVLLGVAGSDAEEDVDWLVDKVVGLRIFANESGRFDRSLRDIGGALLVVSQFTLFADTRKGRRPSFSQAAQPEKAISLYERFLERTRALGLTVQSGEFGSHMQVALENDGPVTLLLDSTER